jgi:lysophospholipase L1-like esterase
MKTKIAFLLAFLILTNVFAKAQQKSIFFKKGDRVCFIGNSITHNGEFHHNILQYFVTRYPQVQISFYNNGIKGDVVNGVLNRLEKDILIHKPTHAIIMIGMNDVQRELYGKSTIYNPDTLNKRKLALERYAKNLSTLVTTLFKKGIKIILQKPSAYDQTSTIKQSNNLGVNEALIQCGSYMQQLANKYKLPIVDFGTIMTNITLAQQNTTPNFTLTVNDRVHPNNIGHFVMSYQFLKTLNPDTFVSKIVLDIKNLNRKTSNKNCEIFTTKYNNNSLHFSAKAFSLPFPISDNQLPALNLVPFTSELNKEIIQIQNLPKGNYQLLIDSIQISKFTNEELHVGVNLATNKNTPQYKQALKVKMALAQLWENEATVRAIAFVEYMYLQNKNFNNDLTTTKKYLDSLNTNKFKGQVYYTNAFEKYITYKPKLSLLLKQADSIRASIYKIAQTNTHVYQIIKINEPTVADLIEASQSDAMPLLFDVQSHYLIKEVGNFNNKKECYVRNGLPNFLKKINQQNTAVTIGFLGGSITKAEDQYRNQTLAFLQSLNPMAKIKGVNAGVSGTGTELGACRVNNQILKYSPDLVFIEFAVNGGSNQALEGIIRQIKKHNPAIDICLIYTIAGEQYKLYTNGEIPAKIEGFEKVANHYQIPSIHMGLYPSYLENQNALIWKSKNRIGEKIIFSNDGTHPTRAGGDLYAQSIMRSFDTFKKSNITATTIIPEAMYQDNWENGGMFEPSDICTFSDEWEKINTIEDHNLKAFAPWFTTIFKTKTSLSYFNFKFKGTAFGFFDIGGPEAGQVFIEIDGKCQQLIKKAGNASSKLNNDSTMICLNNRFNSNCNNRYRGQFELFEVADGIHDVKISLSSIKANKLAILEGQDITDIKSNPEKYNQQVFYLGKILLKGTPIAY